MNRSWSLLAVGALLIVLGLLGTGWFGYSTVRAAGYVDPSGAEGQLPWQVWLSGGGGFVALFAGIMCCIMAWVRFRTRRSAATWRP